MTSPDRLGCKWFVEYLDGRWVSDNERRWDEISVPYTDGKRLMLLGEPAASISAVVGGRVYTLRAPDRETRFFRYYHARTPMNGQSEIMYHAIGYLSTFGKVTLEIDNRGNCQTRVEVNA